MWCDTLHASYFARDALCASRHTSHVTRHTSQVTCHTSHVTSHTSHVTHMQEQRRRRSVVYVDGRLPGVYVPDEKEGDERGEGRGNGQGKRGEGEGA